MPFHLKSLGSYVYVKTFGPGETTFQGIDISHMDKGTLTFDSDGNQKGEFEFIDYPLEEYDWARPEGRRYAQLKETRTGWFVEYHPSWRVILIDRPSLVGFEETEPGVIRSINEDWLGDRNYLYMLPTGNPWGHGGNSFDGRCLREDAIRLVKADVWEYERCEDMRWEYETPSPSPSPSTSSKSKFPIWNPTKKDFWNVENYALWIYAVGLLCVLGGAAAAALVSARM